VTGDFGKDDDGCDAAVFPTAWCRLAPLACPHQVARF